MAVCACTGWAVGGLKVDCAIACPTFAKLRRLLCSLLGTASFRMDVERAPAAPPVP